MSKLKGSLAGKFILDAPKRTHQSNSGRAAVAYLIPFVCGLFLQPWTDGRLNKTFPV